MLNKVLLLLLILLLLPIVVGLSPMILIYLCVDRHYEYKEKVKGLIKKESNSSLLDHLSVNKWVNGSEKKNK